MKEVGRGGRKGIEGRRKKGSKEGKTAGRIDGWME